MSHSRQTLEQIFETQVQNLSLTLQPFTVVKYQYAARRFVGYLRATFPEVRRLSQLRRDSPYAGLVPLALRAAAAHWEPYPRAAFALSSTPARRLGRPKASSFAKIFLFVPSISPGPFLLKTINCSRKNCAAQTACIPNALLLTQRHRDPHWRMHPPAARLCAARRARTVGAACSPRKASHRTLGTS